MEMKMGMELSREKLENEMKKLIKRRATNISRKYSGRNLFHGGYVSNVYDWQGRLLEKHYEILQENGLSRLVNYIKLSGD